MTRILIAVSDNAQCAELGFGLTSTKRTVELATTAQDAIKTGLRYRPDVLIVDSTFAGSVSGVLVSEAIQAVHERTQTILLTDLASDEFKRAGQQAKIFGILEKPLEIDRISVAVDKAEETDPLPTSCSVGLIEYGSEDDLIRPNTEARRMLGLPRQLSEQHKPSTLFSYRTRSSLRHADKEWIQVSPAQDPRVRFRGFVRKEKETNFLILLEEENEGSKQSDVVQLLIGAKVGETASCPIKERVLLVEPDKLQRHIASSQLKKIQCRFHVAENYERAVQILKRDPLIGIVLFDCESLEGDLDQAVQTRREIRPNVTIVGTRTDDKRGLEECGVDLLLPKPVLARSLVRLLEKQEKTVSSTRI